MESSPSFPLGPHQRRRSSSGSLGKAAPIRRRGRGDGTARGRAVGWPHSSEGGRGRAERAAIHEARSRSRGADSGARDHGTAVLRERVDLRGRPRKGKGRKSKEAVAVANMARTIQ